MRIGILQTGESPVELRTTHGDYDDLFRQLFKAPGISFRTWRALDGTIPATIRAADAWIITGSRHAVYENHAWIAPLERFVQELAVDKRPTLGVCFGHQLMAKALGGRVERASQGWQVGPIEYWSEAGEKLRLNAWHRDQVTRPPSESRIVWNACGCRVAALSYGTWGFSVQAHPEFDGAFLRALAEVRRATLPSDVADRLDGLVYEHDDGPTVAQSMLAHLRGQH